MTGIESYFYAVNRKLNSKIQNLERILYNDEMLGEDVFECPACNYKTIHKVPENADEELICPNCSITTPETITLHEIKENITKDSKVLQIYAKEGLHNYFIKNLNDKDQYLSLADNDEPFNKKVDDYANTNLDNDSFDLIVAIHIIDMIENDTQTLKEMHRLLKKDGKLIIKANADFDLEETIDEDYIDKENQKIRFYGNPYALRNYGKDIIKKIEEIGFTVTYKDPKTLPTTKLTRGQLTLDPILVCSKKN